jgi:hypothetical protein
MWTGFLGAKGFAEAGFLCFTGPKTNGPGLLYFLRWVFASKNVANVGIWLLNLLVISKKLEI